MARKLAVLLHHLWISCEEYGRHHNPLARGQREYQNRSLSCMGACTPITSMMSTPTMPAHRLQIGSDAVGCDIGVVPKPIDPRPRLRRRLLKIFRAAVRGSRDLSKLFRAGKSFPTPHRVFEVFPGIATDSVMLKPDRAGVFHPTQQPQHLRHIIRAAVQWLD